MLWSIMVPSQSDQRSITTRVDWGLKNTFYGGLCRFPEEISQIQWSISPIIGKKGKTSGQRMPPLQFLLAYILANWRECIGQINTNLAKALIGQWREQLSNHNQGESIASINSKQAGKQRHGYCKTPLESVAHLWGTAPFPTHLFSLAFFSSLHGLKQGLLERTVESILVTWLDGFWKLWVGLKYPPVTRSYM